MASSPPPCLQAKPENLVDTFILLMPATAKTANDLARVCELKVGQCRVAGGCKACCVHVWRACSACRVHKTQAQQDARVSIRSGLQFDTSARHMWWRCCCALGNGVPSNDMWCCLPWLLLSHCQGFTKKLQGELIAQFMRKTGGTAADGMASHSPSPAAAAFAASTGSSSSSSYYSSSAAERDGRGLGAAAISAPAAFGSGSGSASGIGGGGGSFGGPGANLSALKLSVNTFTRELASSMSMRDRDGGSPHAAGGGGGGVGSGSGGKPALFKPGGLNFNMQQTAARTREGLAKMAGILPGKLGGGGGGGADAS